jgi:hypothetical protein
MAGRSYENPHSYKAEAALSSTNYRFVKLGTNAQEVNTCGAGELPVGIRQNSPDAAGKGVEVVSIGCIAKLTLGSGGATAGAYLKSDSAGAGVATTTNADIVGAIALEAGSQNEVISVLVQIMPLSAAHSHE